MFNGSREVRERIDALETKAKALREEVDTLTRKFSLDWEELQDKVHRWMQRTGARERSEAKAEQRRGVDHWQGTAAPVTDPVSARILARRARGGVRAVPPLPTDAPEVDQGGELPFQKEG